MATITNHSIKTPHAAVKIWNYEERMTATGPSINVLADADTRTVIQTAYSNTVSEQIISTLSLVNIQTNKSKGNPVGTFNFTLAPTRNWVSVITPGSWCVILMSNNPITKQSFEKADMTQVKMFGRIDTIRVEVVVDDEGARQTRYLVSGQDWGSIFNNHLYVDPLIADPKDIQGRQGNALFQLINNYLLSKSNTPSVYKIPGNLRALLSVFGSPLPVEQTTRLAKPTHRILIPQEALDFFGFIDETDKKASSTDLSKIIALQTGSLNTSEGEYDTEIQEGRGWINPFTLVGQHTLWSVLMDNNNYVLNELYPEFRWKDQHKPQLTLYNRIRPFSFQKYPLTGIDANLRSKFENVVTHPLDNKTINSVNAGTNWADKYNFAEVKPEFQELNINEIFVKLKAQVFQKREDGTAITSIFDREGFRPLILSIKQIPAKNDGEAAVDNFDIDLFSGWVKILQEWYFDTHRLLNGRLTMTGSSEYIPVGDNILFDAGLVGVSHNYNSGALEEKECYVLAHVESVSHSFSVSSDGARAFQTTIQFVRGIITDKDKQLIGEGTIDSLSSSLSREDSRNNITTIATPATTNDIEKESNKEGF
jgi:hypothetical protein